jgi:cyclase
MLKTRLIPVLLLKNGQLVRSEDFSTHQIIGDPLHEVKRFNEWNVDELIYIDITKGHYTYKGRSDHKTKGVESPMQILKNVSKTCFVPLTWGGRIRNYNDAVACFQNAADKITLNTALFETPELATKIANDYGQQALVASIDVMRHDDKSLEVFCGGRDRPKGKNPVEWARQIEGMGVGEIFLQAMHKDGKGSGYDLDLIEKICNAVEIPVIACSGVGTYEHYVSAVNAGASAVAAANIWHFKEMSDKNAKRALSSAGINVRFKEIGRLKTRR